MGTLNHARRKLRNSYLGIATTSSNVHLAGCSPLCAFCHFLQLSTPQALSLSLSLSPTLLPLPFYLFTHPLRHLFFSVSARVPFGLSPDPVPCDFLPGREKHALGGRLQLSSI